MNASISRQEFLKSDQAELLRKDLQAMVKDPGYNTNMMYTLQLSSGSQFVEKHMAYMANHLRMDHRQYVLNVKLMTKLKA